MDAGLQKNGSQDRNWKATEQDKPRSGTIVKYRTEYYQMLGYLDKGGQWMAADGHRETREVRAWRELADPKPTGPEIS